MKIGFDLDGIFIKGPPLIPKKIIERLYKERDHGVLLYRIPGKLEQKLRKLSHLGLLRGPIKKNLEFLKSNSKGKNHDFFLISSRFGFLKKQTEKLIAKHSLDVAFEKLNFNYQNEQPHEFKSRVVKEKKLDRYIDDDLSLIKYLAKNNPGIIFYWLNKFQKKKLADNILAVTDISEILK